jgi:uncharacterized protein YjbI with pentapeptide repeats
MMHKYTPYLLLSLLLATFHATIGNVINHTGHVSVKGTPYTGTGQFKFAIVDENGSSLWNNDGSLGEEPVTAVSTQVKNGFYSVQLGDESSPGMTKLLPSVLDRDDPTYLRMWFGESNATVDRLGVDQRLGATPYALVAEVSRGTPALEIKITQALAEITQLKEQMATTEAKVVSLEGRITTTEAKVLSLEQRITTTESNVANLTNLPAGAIDPVLLAQLGYKTFSRRTLNGLIIEEADFKKGKFDRSIISAASLLNSDFSLAELSEAEIRDSNFTGANFENANLASTTISNTDMSGAKFVGASLVKADLNGSDLSGANLQSADLSKAQFTNVKLGSASFLGATLIKTTLRDIDLSGANLTNLDSSGADFSDSNLTNATVSGSLTGAKFSGADLTGAKFSGADLTGAKFSGADLTGANFSGAIGFDADAHTGTTFKNTILPDGSPRTD